MNLSTLRSMLLALFFGVGAFTVVAQTLPGYQIANAPGDPVMFDIYSISLSNTGVGQCNNYFMYQVKSNSTPVGSNMPPPNWYDWISLQGGNGSHSFNVDIEYYLRVPSYIGSYWLSNVQSTGFTLLVDGVQTGTITNLQTLSLTQPEETVNGVLYRKVRVHQTFTVNHSQGDSYNAAYGQKEFALAPYYVGNYGYGSLCCSSVGPYYVSQSAIRWYAVMVGTTITNTVGHFTTPPMPEYILRRPPGTGSFTQLELGDDYCYGESIAITSAEGANAWGKVKIGTEATVGLFVETEVSASVTASVSTTRTEVDASNKEYETCLSTNSTWTTAAVASEGDDVFIGCARRYAYGFIHTVSRNGCSPAKSRGLGIAPGSTSNDFALTEQGILTDMIPQAQQLMDNAVVNSVPWKTARNTRDAWQRMIDMNNAIKADAIANTTPNYRTFDGGGLNINIDESVTTSAVQSMEVKVVLDSDISTEFDTEAGGSGFSGGAEITFSREVGKGQTSTQTYTTTHTVHYEDDNAEDHFEVPVYRDRSYGALVFGPLDDNSETSCPYEGGVPLDQPALWVGTEGSSISVVNEAQDPTIFYTLHVCNDSPEDRNYFLKLVAGSNAENAELIANGTVIGSDILGIDMGTVPAGECEVYDLQFTRSANPATVDYSLGLSLYSPCEPGRQSTVTVEAHYGTGNFGNYCEPSSAAGTAVGDWIDGVQLGSINNTGTGGFAGASYTDYTGQFSTALPLNSQQFVTITSGSYGSDRYAVWIDYDQNATFDADEQLGEFSSTGSFQANSITFTVPVTADPGTTRMRVRGVDAIAGNWPSGVPIDPCYPFMFGETEDYTVVITNATPLDCQGVSNGPSLPGTACADGNASTGNDTWNANCACTGVPLDCAGVPDGTTGPGTACDDGNAQTGNDVYGTDCVCAGQPLDCFGVPGGDSQPGLGCDDGDDGTGADTWDNDCVCAGLPFDCDGNPGGSVNPGALCDDGNPLTNLDVINEQCVCTGALVNDCEGVEGGTAQPGTPCDDGDLATGNDYYGTDCICAGAPYDCSGTAGGAYLPGSACDDGFAFTYNDVLLANCSCIGVLAVDCAGIEGGTVQPGTACDDGNELTVGDVYDPYCTCVGQPLDCNGTPGGFAFPGTECSDNNETTGADVYGTDCICAGLPFDCAGIPGGTATAGTPCDDGNAATTDDAYGEDCICVGTFANDCEGVAGGPAQPGTACDDGDANTGNDVYDANCTCIGALIDCAGTAGGTALPGTACDDANDCTTTDVYATDCTCTGTTVSIGNVSGSNLVIGLTTNAYVVTPVPGATSYEWTLPNGWTTNDNSGFVIVANADNTAGDVELCVTATVGACEVTSCITVTVDFNTGMTTAAANTSEWFTVQPNPSNGVFQLIPANAEANMEVTVYDGTGRVVKATFPVVGKRAVSLDLGEVSPGAYYLLATREGEQIAMKLIVRR